ncbi:sugar phosphate isomerase/epimerase [Mangrovimicrobium sediminis]|uniref:Sugar phosphate isomerase/epimerase n=1 Tax=Mangrovimicrobium sediminis TaxID=2562682 RepID=A0A4Z0M8V5_9GAMM|nr:sugar phosphate isomerase/epimerase [Haliea sp. SAOS-164]TGD75807.1 sugar phosphate isomerase/epimerase [Haliea sp. SAOS-164]
MDVRFGMDMRLWGDSAGVAQLPVLETLAGLGYQGVEIPVGGQGESALKLLRVALDDLDLAVNASACLPPEANPIAADARVRRRALDTLKTRLDEAALLGAKLLVGGFFQARGCFSGQPATDREWEWSRHCLGAAADHAASLGITLALEFQSRYDAYLINTAAAAARMCRDVGRDNLGVTYNTFHAHLEELNPAQALPSAGDRLLHVRVSESNRGTLGRGQVQWQETFATLEFLDYSGWIVVQALGTGQAPPHPDNIWRDGFESREALCEGAIVMLQELVRRQRP